MGTIAKPVRRQIIGSFYLIFVWSIIATLVTWGIIAVFFFSYVNQLNPANYYEKQIPTIIEQIEKRSGEFLSIENKSEIEKLIPLEGLNYQVLNGKGEFLYGSMDKQYIHSQKELFHTLNSNMYDKNEIIQYYPIFNHQDQYIGSVGFRYSLTLAAANPNNSWLFILIGLLAFLSPFFYFLIFSYVIGRKFSKKMEVPFKTLMDATKKIQNHDLDFQLVESKASKELNQLAIAFEDMRCSLHTSLVKQWELEEERKEMVVAIAHDLRTPLTIIHGHTEMLIEGGSKNSERLSRYLQTIYSNTERSIRLINQLNDMSPHFIIQSKPIRLIDFVQYKTDEYHLLCAEKQIAFTTHTYINEEIVSMDVDRISQVLDNIVTNSIRYCPKDGKIDWTITQNKTELIFEIADNGPGFQSVEQKQVCKKFYRGDDSRAGSDTNFGLGLYIAQMIVKKHHGSMRIKNHEKGGAFTKIVIPLRDDRAREI